MSIEDYAKSIFKNLPKSSEQQKRLAQEMLREIKRNKGKRTAK